MDVNSLFEDINKKFDIRSKNRLTQFFIMTAAVLFADLSWSWLSSVLKGELGWTWVIIGISLFLALLGLNWLMFKKNILILSVSFGVIFITYLTIFGFRLENLLVALAALLLYSYSSYRAIQEKEARITINIFKIMKTGLPLVLTALALTIATAYYFSPLSQQIKEIEVPRPLYEIVIRPFMTQLTGQGSETGAHVVLDPAIAKEFDIALSEAPTQAELEDALFVLVNRQLNAVIEPFKEFYPLGYAIAFFILLKTLGYFLMYLVIFASWIVFRGLVSLGAIKINVEPAVKEVIEM